MDNNNIPTQNIGAPQGYPPQQPNGVPQNFAPQQSFNQPQKPQKPIYKKWWFWVIIVFVFICVISALGDSEDDNSSTTTSISQQEEATSEKTIQTTKEKTTETTTKFDKKEYKSKCEKINYKDLARTPDKYEGKNVKFTGEVVQVIESSWSDTVEYRISVSKEDWGYSSDDIVYVEYTPTENEPRILEDDIVTFYGEAAGLCSYNSTLGGKITIPQVNAKVIELEE